MSNTTQPPKTLTKHEVIALLGKSKRTIDTYMSDGRLPYHYVQGPNGKQAEFDAGDVERLKRVLDTPILPDPKGVALARVAHPAPTNGANGDKYLADAITQFGESLRTFEPRTHTTYVPLKDACAITGLSAATIKALAEGDGVRTMPYGGGVRYRRADLEGL
jgi:predicted DNA-binding transcriptional regulator AlpA